MNQSILVGIIIGVFFAGMGISYAVFMTGDNSNDVNNLQDEQIIQKVMNEPQLHQQVMELMTNNPEEMGKWFADKDHVVEMAKTMKENHEFMQEMMVEIIDDPSLRLQMLGHMTENQEALEQMKKLTENIKSTVNGMKMESKQDSVDFSNIRITNLTPTSVTIVSTTDIAVNCKVEYGVDGELVNTASDSTMMNMGMPHETHMVLITELTPNTDYDFRFKAMLDEQTFYSNVKSFMTPDI